jgi:hypothetical protein
VKIVRIQPRQIFYLLLAAIPVIIFVIKIDIWPFVDGKTLPEGFSRIPGDATNIKNLVSNIIPGETVRYWQYEEWMTGHATLIRSVGESSLRKRINSFDVEGGFFSNCVPIPVCHSVVSYITDDEVKYVTSEEAMVKFIGKVDNLEEAILIAMLKGLYVDAGDTRGGSYRKTSDGFELYLVDTQDCPVTSTSVKVNLTLDGKFTSQNERVYYRSEDCNIY